MDLRVFDAQTWVNSTYGDVDGYDPCPEDGKTGWSTMYSLTMALQHELGITALSANFGPTTLGKLTAHGGVPVTEQNKNLVKILQHGCYCKGYDAGATNGVFHDDTKAAIGQLMSDAGVGSLGSAVQPKVVKALLTMDAYVVVLNGTEAVRGIQRWLNGRYLSHRDFYVIPCDGNFSRDVQKALLLAIQFELGMSDDQATGAFGPGTQAGLRNHEVATGSTGVWVQLFSAAMVFNRYGSFGSSFTTTLASSVRDFQSFSMLPGNGRGDFATWAQLLVSTGDPNRPGTAADCITTITPPRAQQLYSAGYRVIGRYLDEHGDELNKKIQPGELAVIFGAGLRVFPISQYYGGAASYFTETQGYTDARDAHNAAYRNGFRQGTVIYFAVDFDATQVDIDDRIIAYFNGVKKGLASQAGRYVHGVYGSRNVCAEVSAHTGAKWSFVSGMSTGFSGNMGFALPSNWSFNQIQTLTVGSGDGQIEIDKNIQRTGTDPAVSSVENPTDSLGRFVKAVEDLYGLAIDYQPNGSPSRRVLEYLRYLEYDGLDWEVTAGAVDKNFIRYVLDTAVRAEVSFFDAKWQIPIGTAHLAATCNAYVYRGLPGSGANLADFAGWGGDLSSFYGQWRSNFNKEPSATAYCEKNLALPTNGSLFTLDDLIGDAAGYTIAAGILAGKGAATAVRENLQWTDNARHKLERFRQARMGGTLNGTRDAAKQLLTTGDLVLTYARNTLIDKAGGSGAPRPGDLPAEDLDDFCMGFANKLHNLIVEEYR